jgi:hypothetical protein
MRIVILTIAAALGFAVPAQAATYQVDLSTISSVGFLYGPCYCGGGPVYPVMYFQPGDTVDFGSVTLFSYYDSHDAGRDPNPPPYAAFNFVPAVRVSFDPLSWPQADALGFSKDPISYSVQLEYVIPTGANSIQIGWDGNSVYSPPVMASSVPEASTWAMMLIGLAGIGFVGYRRSRARQSAFT